RFSSRSGLPYGLTQQFHEVVVGSDPSCLPGAPVLPSRSTFPIELRPALLALASLPTKNPQQVKWARQQVKKDAGFACELCGAFLQEEWRVSWFVPPVLGGSVDRSNVVATCMKCHADLAGR